VSVTGSSFVSDCFGLLIFGLNILYLSVSIILV
jgi:hypothetical protein